MHPHDKKQQQLRKDIPKRPPSEIGQVQDSTSSYQTDILGLNNKPKFYDLQQSHLQVKGDVKRVVVPMMRTQNLQTFCKE